ncbi:MAG TPA: aminotransferase class V-fold PLP-dependent enzyme [Candidatus Paceibacterota bacterium]|nr:aminotransferase class V-fold PLP-dependent enzyme [Candidatus Paceibacterota bacterium]
MKEIYLDNAAATRPDARVVRAMVRATHWYGNPSSFNDAGRAARAALDAARDDVARFLYARASEIMFCASGSEANALALNGTAGILTQPTEHPSVLGRVDSSARFVRVDAAGRVDPAEVIAAIRADTRIVSVMYANNETGTVQPIKKLARLIREYRRTHQTAYPFLHVDACQATAWLPMNVQDLGADLLTFNGLKVHGPAGTAVLYARRGVQHGIRAGTENVPGAVGLAAALNLIKKNDAQRVGRLRRRLLERLPIAVPGIRINGSTGDDSLPNIINISIPGMDSERLLLALDRRGIRAGAGSACTAHQVEPSHVLVAMKVPRRYLGGVLRISMSRFTTQSDVDAFLRELPKAILSC